MCGTNFFVSENVEQAKEIIKAEGGEDFLARVDSLVGNEAKKAAVAGLLVLAATEGLDDLVKIGTAIEAMFTAGVGLGIALSGNAYRVPYFSEEAAAEQAKTREKAQKLVDDFEAAIDRELATTFVNSASVA